MPATQQEKRSTDSLALLQDEEAVGVVRLSVQVVPRHQAHRFRHGRQLRPHLWQVVSRLKSVIRQFTPTACWQ